MFLFIPRISIVRQTFAPRRHRRACKMHTLLCTMEQCRDIVLSDVLRKIRRLVLTESSGFILPSDRCHSFAQL